MRKRFAVFTTLLTLLFLLGCPKQGVATLTSVVPSVIEEGAPATLVTLTGSGFIAPTVAELIEGTTPTVLATTLVNSQKLTATVPASLLEKAGTAQILAQIGSGGNQTVTQALAITIGNVPPTLTGCTPCHVIDNAASLSVTLTGTNFNSSSVANWNTTALSTTVVSSTQITVTVPATLYASTGTEKLTVVNSGTGGGTTASLTFTVVAPLVITPATLPGGNLGTVYSATLTAGGGVTPYTWSIVTGTLPAGLSLSSGGVISGTPTAAGSSTFTVQVVDSTGSLARRLIK